MVLRNNLAVHFYSYFDVYLATALIADLSYGREISCRFFSLPSGQRYVGRIGKGLAHGFLLLVDIIRSLFDTKIGIYETPNAGERYNLGFFFGVVLWYWLRFFGEEMRRGK